MNKTEIILDDVDLSVLYGKNNVNLNVLIDFFPDLKIVARGNAIWLQGELNQMGVFQEKLQFILDVLRQKKVLHAEEVKDILSRNKLEDVSEFVTSKDVLLFGNNGLVVKAQTISQQKLVDSVLKNDMVFAIGPAGTGKTYTAVALAVKALKNKEVRKIILTRPAVEAGENLGFLPGDLKEKLDPYLLPLYDALHDMIQAEKLKYYLENQIIQIAPLAFMRGRTLDHAFVILDEAQNATKSQLKMFLTRMGRHAKFVITGDLTQVDLPKNQPSGLWQVKDLLANIEGIDFIYLEEKDVIRHKLVRSIIKAYKNAEEKTI